MWLSRVQGPSRQELIRQRRRATFIGRHDELAGFRENFTRDPGDEAYQFVFHVHGNAGVGKTSLVRRWEDAAREQGAITTYLDDDVHSAVEAMEAISQQLGRQGLPLKEFNRLVATYKQRRHEALIDSAAQTLGTAGTGQAPAASTSSTVAARAGLAALGMVPGVGAFTSVVDPQQIAQGVDRLRAVVSARLRDHDDVELVLSPLQVLTPVFLEDLAEVARRRPWMMVSFDAYERTAPVLDAWLRELLFGDRYGELATNVLVVLSGQGRLNTRYWGDCLDLVAEVQLDAFTDHEARQLLAAKGITDEALVRVVLRLSGRLPVLVDTLAQNHPTGTDAINDPSATAVERFLKWESSPHHRVAALSCALPLQLNEDIFRAATPAEAAEEYSWLQALPFVTNNAGRCRYHEVVRGLMLRHQRIQSPAQWRDQHIRLANLFEQWRQVLEEVLPPEKRWDDAAWCENRLNETYHRLCAHAQHALPDALLETVHACDHSIESLHRWVQMLGQAGEDTDSVNLAPWAQHLRTAADDGTSGSIAALSLLLNAPELSAVGKALGYAIRGREHRKNGNLDSSLNDYTAAITLSPDFARAYQGRGWTYEAMNRYPEAAADLNRAIELDANDSSTLINCGIANRVMNRLSESLATFTRAIELDPTDSAAYAHRSATYHFMNHMPEALADLDRAIELDQTSAWPVRLRAGLYHAMGRYDEALADWARSVAIEPDPFNRRGDIVQRGETHSAMGRYEEALADFSEAIEMDSSPNSGAFFRRGITYRRLARYPEAMADLHSALETIASSNASNGADGWYHFEFAVLCRLMSHDEESEHWRRAVEIFTEEASRGGYHGAWARGNLLVTFCAILEWDKATEQLESFLATPPNPMQIADVLNDLNDLQRTLSIETVRVDLLRRRLEVSLEEQQSPR